MHNSDDAPEDSIDLQIRIFDLAKKRGLSVSMIAAQTSLKKDTVAAYAKGANGMSFANAKKIIAVLPQDIGSLLIEDTGYRLQPIDIDATNWPSIAAEAAGLVSEICDAQADGHIDHREDRELREHSRRVIAKLAGVVNS